MRFEETYIGKVVLISVGLGIATLIVRFVSGETDRGDWIAALLLWAVTSAGMAGLLKAMRR